jgi:hypothetical protein
VWDWDDELQGRHWRTASLHWARDIHPAHRSLSWIQSHFDPPAHEMWCHHSENETANDCAIFHDLLEDWLIHYMDTPNPPGAAFSSFPQECQTICTP